MNKSGAKAGDGGGSGWIEHLEGRTLLAAPGGTPATALDLGALVNSKSITESIGKGQADYYRFSTGARGNFNLTLDRMTGDANVQVLSSRRAVVYSSSNAGTTPERISTVLNKGTYYVRVAGAGGKVATPYRLSLRADLNWGTVESGGRKRAVGLVMADGSTRAINPKLETWVVIHGWNGTPYDLARLSRAIDAYSAKDQVLALDWSAAAAELTAFEASAWVSPVAQFAANALRRWGIANYRIDLAGHSLGGWVAGDLAEEISGGVNRIIAMDPATDLPGLFISGVDYAEHSRYSAAYIGSSYGTPEAAATADETFRVDVGPYDSIFSHMLVPDLVASMIAANNTPSPDRISAMFSLDTLDPTVTKPWKANAYSGIYEGTIKGEQIGFHWCPQTLTYVSAGTLRTVVVSNPG